MKQVGDITYLSKKARKMLDEAGFPDCQICASNSLDEYIIADMLRQGAKIDSFGVGERLITASSEPVFGGVYKVVSILKDGVETPKIKISENVAKITNPCFKDLYRLYDKETNKAIALQMLSPFLTRKLTIQNPILYSTPNTLGNAKL